MSKAEYYRSSDPLENLKFFLNIRETVRPKDFNSSERDEKPYFLFQKQISWQQKFFSPSEIADYIHNKDSPKRGSPAQVETRSVLTRMQSNGTDIVQLLQPVMFYTYIDRDHHETEEVLTRGGRTRNIPNVQFRDNSYKVMHFCFATDVQVDKLLVEKYDEYDKYFNEHILCSIKVFQDGLIEVSPALSKIIGEPSSDLPPDLAVEYHKTLNPVSISAVQPLSLFLTDNTAEAALKKGYRLSTLKFRSQSGSDFEYVIYNKKDVMLPQQIEELMLKDELLDSIRSSEIRSIFKKNNWKQDPTTLDYVYSLQCEIVSASNYTDVNKLFVTYQLYHPTAWKLRIGNLTDAEANVGPNANSVQYNPMDNYGMLTGITHTARFNSNKFANFYLSQQREGKQGHYLYSSRRSSFSFFTRVVFGVFFFAVSILSILEGISNAIWVFPVMVLVLIMIKGISSNSSVLLLPASNKSKGKYSFSSRKAYETSDLFQLESLSKPDDFIFNHMLNYNFDAKDLKMILDQNDPNNYKENIKNQLFMPSVTQQYPILFVQVYSKGYFGHSTLLGYADCIFPLESNEFEKEISSWKPIGNIRSQLHEFFIGDNIHLKDLTYIQDFDNRTKSLNRFGVLTQSTGKIKIRGKVIKTDTREIERKRQQELENMSLENQKNSGMSSSSQKLMNNFKIKKSVAEIMKNFKDAKKGGGGNGVGLNLPSISEEKNEGAAAGKLNRGPGERPSIRSILESINSNAKTSKSTELLNRLRIKKAENTNVGNPAEEKRTDLAARKLELPQSKFPQMKQEDSVTRKDEEQESLLGENRSIPNQPRKTKNRYDKNSRTISQDEEDRYLDDRKANEEDNADDDAPLLKP